MLNLLIRKAMAKLTQGDLVPEFSSTTQDGTPFSNADLAGKRTVLYFYPKDNTSGCTLEAKSLRDGKAELAAMGFQIVVVSPDSERSHQNFCAKHELNFTLLADTDHSVCEAFGVWAEKSMYGRKYWGVVRTTFIINEEGCIEKVFDKVDTKNHYQQIINSYK
jgi:peroxiredoxin Q/BCP